MEKIKVLFICMGNICRSPTAEGVFVKLIKDQQLDTYFTVDSAGTHAHHIGEAPDLRSQKAALERGIELAHLRSRKVTYADFENFDYLLVMDDDNYSILYQSCPEPYKDKIQYLLDYAPHLTERQVPDPYYGGSYGFEQVLNKVEMGAVGFLNTLRATGKLA